MTLGLLTIAVVVAGGPGALPGALVLVAVAIWALPRRHRSHASADQRSGPRYRRRSIPIAVRHEVWLRDGGVCSNCGSDDELEFDHIVPVSRGGSNTAVNVELLCQTCNRRKGARI